MSWRRTFVECDRRVNDDASLNCNVYTKCIQRPLFSLMAPTSPTASMTDTKRDVRNPILFECAWEVANKVGGIYTVIKSKVPVTVSEFGDRYTLIGPLSYKSAPMEVEAEEPTDPHIAATLESMRVKGVKCLYGRWLIDGNPHVLLFDTGSQYHRIDEWKGDLWNLAGIPTPPSDHETNESIVFGYVVAWFLGEVCPPISCNVPEFVLTFLFLPFFSISLASFIPQLLRTSTNGRPGSPFLSAGSGTSMSPLSLQLMQHSWADTSALAPSTSTIIFNTSMSITKRGSVVSTTDIASNALLPTAPMSLPPSPTLPPMRQNISLSASQTVFYRMG